MLLIYGANGYTGRLVVEECVRRGIRPILAGRQRAGLEPLALAYGLDLRVAAVTAAHSAGPRPVPHGTLPASPSAELLAILEGVTVVRHCAGPFVHTSAIMVQACLAVGAHYLDITGEISVFEACRQQDLAARQRGTVVLPGVGFDVVPTDCLAMRLAEALPGGSLLELAFAGGGGVSRGTLKTMLLNGSGGAIRREGTIVPVPTAWRTRTIPFHDRPRTAVTIPWGDVSTAQWSTRIPTIHTYIALPTAARIGMRLQSVAQPLLHLPGVRRFLERQIDRRVTGHDAALGTRYAPRWTMHRRHRRYPRGLPLHRPRRRRKCPPSAQYAPRARLPHPGHGVWLALSRKSARMPRHPGPHRPRMIGHELTRRDRRCSS